MKQIQILSTEKHSEGASIHFEASVFTTEYTQTLYFSGYVGANHSSVYITQIQTSAITLEDVAVNSTFLLANKEWIIDEVIRVQLRPKSITK